VVTAPITAPASPDQLRPGPASSGFRPGPLLAARLFRGRGDVDGLAAGRGSAAKPGLGGNRLQLRLRWRNVFVASVRNRARDLCAHPIGSRPAPPRRCRIPGVTTNTGRQEERKQGRR
jgi:hypothetical protein